MSARLLGERRRADLVELLLVEQLVGLGDRIGQRLLGGNSAEQGLLDGRAGRWR